MANNQPIFGKFFRSYLLKSSDNPDLKNLARDFYQEENNSRENRFDDKAKLDPAKFVNPIKPLHVGLRFAMDEIQIFIDQSLLPEKGSAPVKTNDSASQASSTSQSIVKGLLITPLWLISIPVRILDKLADDILSPLFWGAKGIVKNNVNVIHPLHRKKISSIFKDTYAIDDPKHSADDKLPIDPLKVINPFKALRMELSLLAVQTAGLFNHLFPSYGTPSPPSRIFKALLVTPLILIAIPVRILENITDTLLSPLRPIVKWLRNQNIFSSSLTNKPSFNPSADSSRIDSTQRMYESGITSWHSKPDYSEHGLSSEQLIRLQQDPENAADLGRLSSYQKEYKELVMEAEKARTPTALKNINEKVNEIQDLLDQLKKRLPAASAASVASFTSPTPATPSIDNDNKHPSTHG